MNTAAPAGFKTPTVNLRTPELLAAVQTQIQSCYCSDLVNTLRLRRQDLSIGDLTVRLAKEFGFCYGVERAIDMAYAARKAFPGREMYILGEIIHNPEVNGEITTLGIKNLKAGDEDGAINNLTAEDVVIIPAFGAEVSKLRQIRASGCQIVDTTCGDVMSVWKRVRHYAGEGATSIIHGKVHHEETLATSSRALADGNGRYLVVLDLEQANYLCGYIRHGGNKAEFFEKFRNAHSSGFDPDAHLQKLGMANQTTMLSSETEEIQRRIRQAVHDRDGEEVGARNFQSFDGICRATQERQDALREMLKTTLDILLVVGGYNSSNTTHLVEIGEATLPTYFFRDASCLRSPSAIAHYDWRNQQEIVTDSWLPAREIVVGITAGASCPNNLIEDVILRLFELRGVPKNQVLQSDNQSAQQ
jgi:4-hydroxy-3-methylbut-2-en-1-yl diphosphate reductase